MKRKLVSCSNGNIVYWASERLDNSRDTLFFLHGLTANHTMFQQQFSFFEEQFNLLA